MPSTPIRSGTLLSLDDLIDTVAFIDSASGKKASGARRGLARSADVVVATDALSRIYVLHAWADRISTTDHTDRIFKLVEDFHPRVVGIDASAMQSLFADALNREARHRARRLPLMPIAMPTNVDKDVRIRTALQPIAAAGRLFFMSGEIPRQWLHRDLAAEYEAFPGGATKDICDALAEATKLLRRVGAAQQATTDGRARLAWLKESGAPAFYIEEVERTLDPLKVLDSRGSTLSRS